MQILKSPTCGRFFFQFVTFPFSPHSNSSEDSYSDQTVTLNLEPVNYLPAEIYLLNKK